MTVTVPGAGVTGTWSLKDCESVAALSDAVLSASLQAPGIRGFSMRTGWANLNGAMLSAGLALASKAKVAFTPRFMAGRWTPSSVFAMGCPSYLDANGLPCPLPVLADGSPNLVFEQAYAAEVASLVAWARANGVSLLHCSNYAEEYSELAWNPSVRAACTEAQFISAHERLAAICLDAAGGGLAVELPVSGSGPITTIVPALVDNIVATRGSDLMFVQANGLSTTQYFGEAQPAEGELDAVFATAVPRGLQMINPGDYDWDTIYARVAAVNASYVEVYSASFAPTLAHHADLLSNIVSFAAVAA